MHTDSVHIQHVRLPKKIKQCICNLIDVQNNENKVDPDSRQVPDYDGSKIQDTLFYVGLYTETLTQ